MTVKHIALLLAVVLAVAPLCGSSAQSQDGGVRQSVQDRLRSVPGIKEQLTVRPLVTPDGLVPDAETAIKVGEAVIFRFFGETPTKLVPFSATLEDGILGRRKDTAARRFRRLRRSPYQQEGRNDIVFGALNVKSRSGCSAD